MLADVSTGLAIGRYPISESNGAQLPLANVSGWQCQRMFVERISTAYRVCKDHRTTTASYTRSLERTIGMHSM